LLSDLRHNDDIEFTLDDESEGERIQTGYGIISDCFTPTRNLKWILVEKFVSEWFLGTQKSSWLEKSSLQLVLKF